MENIIKIILLVSLVSQIFICVKVGAHGYTFNVVDYGARGDGISNDYEALTKAWNETCKSTGTRTLLIPAGKSILVYPLYFLGPCEHGDIHFKIDGNILAPDTPNGWNGKDISQWLTFKSINGLHISGSGKLDGRGKPWWDNSCRYHPGDGCYTLAPTMLRFDRCKGVSVTDITVTDSPQAHILVIGSENVEISHLTIKSPGNSPNTDGIHVHQSRNLTIHHATIASDKFIVTFIWDDCISIGDQTSEINISDVICGPGHGISIGSLGNDGGVVDVHSITVTNCHFTRTTNGVRIKTWQIGRGSVQHIIFSQLNFTKVENPIIIDQYYCDKARPESCSPSNTGVQISDVLYKNLFGTSKTTVAVNLNCSNNVPCKNIVLDTIKLRSSHKGWVTSSCNQAFGSARGIQKPRPCVR